MKPTGFLCALILPLLLASGQAIPGQEPVVRVTTEVVELQVVVINPNGKPVRGLTRQDFTLLVGDTPQLKSWNQNKQGKADRDS